MAWDAGDRIPEKAYTQLARRTKCQGGEQLTQNSRAVVWDVFSFAHETSRAGLIKPAAPSPSNSLHGFGGLRSASLSGQLGGEDGSWRGNRDTAGSEWLPPHGDTSGPDVGDTRRCPEWL